jgi:LmbE family N-acetylglucosaminyl deacetylase
MKRRIQESMKTKGQASGVRRQKRFTIASRGWRTGLALSLLLLSAIAAPGGEQPRHAPPARMTEDDAAELYQSLLDLQNPWTVMCVAAHPDDEDGATLTVLRRKYGAHTVTVFSTYGEGGQNATGPELYEELGAIRARETEEASRIQGSEAYFLGLQDFGFSKSSAEALRFWGHEEALRRMVLKIRQLRPDVIITNHDTSSGHGHHQATGILILEAFDAAADSRRFPEQLRGGVEVWQVQRLFVRVGSPGGAGNRTAEDEAQLAGKLVSINRNERDDVRGKTYAEQALRALQRHASQGPWPQTVPAGWATPIRYRLARSAKDAAPLPPNAQTFLDGLSLPQKLTDELMPLAAKALLPLYSADARDDRLLSALISARRGKLFAAAHAAGTSERARFQLMTERLNRALVVASGIKATLTTQSDVLIPGTTTKVSLKISNEGKAIAQIRGIDLRGMRPSSKLRFPQSLAPGNTLNVELQASTPRTAQISVPHAEHLYDGKLLGEELAASVNVEIQGAAFPVNAMMRIDVAPAVEIASITPSTLVLTPATPIQATLSSGLNLSSGSDGSAPFTLRLVNHQNETFKGEISVGGMPAKNAPQGQKITLAANESREVTVQRRGGFDLIKDSVNAREHPAPNVITFRVVEAGSSSPVTQRSVRVVYSDARVAANLRVGYVRSVDDTLRNALTALGVEAKELTVEDVRAGNLQNYQAIIIDNRGYLAHPELVGANPRLLDYVQAGGTLIVFYHRTNEWNPDPQRNRPQLAPYPIILGNSRVTDETASVEFTEPQHPLLNYPNKITREDFANWIQERGLYYPQSWDKQYSAPLSTNDEKEPPLRGGLLAADYGRGRYIYTSMVWYRQLRAGIPGAYRVLANMISYGRQ